MLDYTTLPVFIAAALALLLMPGPAVIYIVSRSIDQGRMAGIVSTLGIATGTLVHIAAAALGVSAILVTSALAFTVVKYLGAAYLIYLGVRKLFFEEATETIATVKAPYRSVFWQGVLVNLFNPKTALFFFSFLPQFVDLARGNVTLQLLLLSIIFVAIAIVTDSAYALLGGGFGDLLRKSQSFQRAQRYITGVIYVTLGLVTAVSGSGKTK